MSPQTADVINGLFEIIGAICVWLDVWAYSRDREVKGQFWPSTLFYTFWGSWNILYYPTLDQWFSFVGGLFLVSGNLTWVGWVMWDKYKAELCDRLHTIGSRLGPGQRKN